ncbi:hypothetical protein Q7O_002762 [Pectobacterium carotovorum subsp. carotovorum PCCS1]|nr:hypothetical protein [Pectobacterium carotovorum subsp. carotovorum PCCS1]
MIEKQKASQHALTGKKGLYNLLRKRLVVMLADFQYIPEMLAIIIF